MPKRHAPLISSDALLGVLEVSKELGIPIDEELENHDIKPRLVVKPEGFISTVAFADLLADLADKYDCEELGIRIGEARPKLQYGLLTLLPQTSPDVEAAVHYCHKYLRLASDTTMAEMAIKSGIVRIIRKERYPFGKDLTQMRLLGITHHVKFLSAFLGSNWHPDAVYFAHRAPADASHYSRVFRCPLNFDQGFDGFEFAARDLKTPIASSDPVLLATILDQLDSIMNEKVSDDVLDKTRLFIRQHMGTAMCNLHGVSSFLCIHPKALQRELQSYDISFQGLLAETRFDLACDYLEHTDMPLKQLAYMLGYSSPTSFTRAFSKLSGVPPKAWRSAKRIPGTVYLSSITPLADT